jgi:serine phosphatase RsbU (regulator of sigma subunit)
MATALQPPWYLRYPSKWRHFRSVPLKNLRLLLAAVFLLFSTFGFFSDVMSGGRIPYIVVAANVIISGLVAMVWLLVLARLPIVFIAFAIALSVLNPWLAAWTDAALSSSLHLSQVNSETGIRVASVGTMIAIVISYVYFVAFIRREGKESFKLRNELELAHGIQKTLVPPIALLTSRFEIYGISCPSEKVGGDLVDALRLPNGDAIAYLADIAGHGLQAGILMGMLKTAARTALLDAGQRDAAHTLPVLLDRLNSVLPEVKEPHMYATFTGFRLGEDGSVYYALAASPPILHWHANGSALSHLEEEQFPLGLLPVCGFDGQRLETAPGDLLMVATDGILEVCDKSQEEFGLARLKDVIEAHAKAPLFELAKKILEAANGFGMQADDQTILIVRCL